MRIVDAMEMVLVLRPFTLGPIRGEVGAVVAVPVAALRCLLRSGAVELARPTKETK